MAEDQQFRLSELSPQTDAAPTEEALEAISHKPCRVAWLAGPDTFNRIGRILQPLAVGLMDELIGVNVFLPEKADERELPNLPIDVIRYSRMGWLMFRNKTLSTLAQEITNRQITLLHALDTSAIEQARRLSNATGLSYVVSCYSLGDAKRLGPADARVAALLPASENIRRELLENHIAPSDRIHLVRPGVYHVNRATCFPDESMSIAVVAGGQMDDFAAYDALLKTFNDIKLRNYDCQFFIIANGKSEQRIRATADQMGLNPRLTFIDRQPPSQLQGILKSADIYISPVDLPQVDIASLLAMAAGDPVLAPSDSTDDFIIDGKTALTFQRGNHLDLTAKLIRLLDDRPFATGLAESALAYLHENHSPAATVSRVSAVYRQVIEAQEQASAQQARRRLTG